MRQWSTSSRAKLATLHQDLQVLANAVLAVHDCTLVFGHRTEAEQNAAFTAGNSKKQWPNSKHNSLPSVAMDLAPYIPGVDMWSKELVLHFAGIVLGTAEQLRMAGMMMYPVRWGGNWSTQRDRYFGNNTFFDGNHFELLLS